MMYGNRCLKNMHLLLIYCLYNVKQHGGYINLYLVHCFMAITNEMLRARRVKCGVEMGNKYCY
jgi:hypothetical protein